MYGRIGRMKLLLLVSLALWLCLVHGQQSPPPHGVSCKDSRKDCNQFGYSSCRASYRSWAEKYCSKYCGYCGADCKDVLMDCAQYPPDSCNKFSGWAEYNCAKTCGYCYSQKKSTAPCEDVNKDCSLYDKDVCVKSHLNTWVDDNCLKFCGRCGCQDKLPNCVEYGRKICASHRLWSIVNCAAHCKVCGVSNEHIERLVNALPSPPTPARPQKDPKLSGRCEDPLIECPRYDQQVCTRYTNWAQQNCQKTCGYCDCKDRLTNCAQYPASPCAAPYLDWALLNCPRTCGLCWQDKAYRDRNTNNNCYDVAPDCSTKSRDWCEKNSVLGWAVCGKTCRYCDCEDANPHCPIYGSDICGFPYGLRDCKKFCGLCLKKNSTFGTRPTPLTPPKGAQLTVRGVWEAPTTTQTVKPECKDVMSSCAALVPQGVCMVDKATVKSTCAKTCTACASCQYKGVPRDAGQKWNEGCDVSCMCDASGVVTCTKSCPVWQQHVAAGCSLTPGAKCCPRLTCPAQVKVVQPPPRN